MAGWTDEFYDMFAQIIGDFKRDRKRALTLCNGEG